MMATRETLAVGSWSSGTLRSEDWAETLIYMAETVGIDNRNSDKIAALVESLAHMDESDEHECADSSDCPAEWISDAINDAIDVLQEYAPVYCYVGSADGDGAALGVWLSDDALDEAIRNGERIDAETVVNHEDGVRIHVSDHGNVSVYRLSDDAELLAIV